MKKLLTLPLFALLTACGGLDDIGQRPDLTSVTSGPQYDAMVASSLPTDLPDPKSADASSLWSADRAALLGDRRAMQRGDIMTVVIEINDSAQITDTSQRSRSGSTTSTVGSLFGVAPPAGGPVIDASGTSQAKGAGSVSRNEKLTLRIAATIVNVLPNGVFEINGTQEVRVNYELRELTIQGFVRPEDISRQNEITYDKIASARISYGGRGQITEMQQPRYGQQIVDRIVPY